MMQTIPYHHYQPTVTPASPTPIQGLRQSNTSLIKKGHQSISSLSILICSSSSHSISVTSGSSSSTSGFASESIRVEMTDSKDVQIFECEVPNGQNGHDPFFKHYLSLEGKRTLGVSVN